ncbi:MAG: serine protease [Caldilinea sp.]|nr:trypsin-like peptidase domain-containing protein [Caldilinea sp.]MCB0058881.1 trypsin-like peptidase domain-containing protein [Caldilineaceae bacterium]MCB0147143.1 trypsin-like peptidase domain-containing protein [Caldilineaceae bacterium]MCB9116321.1 trypsin-like peptidase domain-containing protein [Caldilineaceae bacterium]MCB9121931.1 trypsin-like peptidase domain-containing protein [Caldilineaceae bacterium]
MATILADLSSALADVSDGVTRSLVQVRSSERGGGAGTIWHADGLIVTNAHVVSDSGSRRSAPRRISRGAISVILPDGRELPAQVLAEDAEHDLAALRVDAHDLPAVTLGDSRRLQAGDLVVALGFPWGVTGGATTGVVIGTGDALPELAGSQREWIAASLHLRPGHSGGPMVDAHGRLVGINTMMNGPDVGIAVPVHVAVAFLKQVFGDKMT